MCVCVCVCEWRLVQDVIHWKLILFEGKDVCIPCKAFEDVFISFFTATDWYQNVYLWMFLQGCLWIIVNLIIMLSYLSVESLSTTCRKHHMWRWKTDSQRDVSSWPWVWSWVQFPSAKTIHRAVLLSTMFRYDSNFDGLSLSVIFKGNDIGNVKGHSQTFQNEGAAMGARGDWPGLKMAALHRPLYKV